MSILNIIQSVFGKKKPTNYLYRCFFQLNKSIFNSKTIVYEILKQPYQPEAAELLWSKMNNVNSLTELSVWDNDLDLNQDYLVVYLFKNDTNCFFVSVIDPVELYENRYIINMIEVTNKFFDTRNLVPVDTH